MRIHIPRAWLWLVCHARQTLAQRLQCVPRLPPPPPCRPVTAPGPCRPRLQRPCNTPKHTRARTPLPPLRCLRHSEPVLLIGETGTGKTTVCQLLALMRHQHLHILNCNQHTETADFIGGFRPTRGRERAAAQLLVAAARVAGSGLLRALGVAAPIVPGACACVCGEGAAGSERCPR